MAECQSITVSARGGENRDVENAKASSLQALLAKIRAVHGKNWSVGSHRDGSFHCDNTLGYRSSWTCTAETRTICKIGG